MKSFLFAMTMLACLANVCGCRKNVPASPAPAPPGPVISDKGSQGATPQGAASPSEQDAAAGKKPPGDGQTPKPAVHWSDERARRQREHQQYIAEDAKGYEWFAHAANSVTGVPFILIRLLPELDPEIWGPPEEEFSRFGFFRTAADAKRPLPTALAWETMVPSATPKPHTVSLTCGACHIGRVRLEAPQKEGKQQLLDLVGGPNTQGDVRKWRHAFEQTMAKRLATPEDIQITAGELIKLVDAKEPGFFYRGWGGFDPSAEAAQREMFKSLAPQMLSEVARGIQAGRLAVDKALRTNYAKSNHPPLDGGTPGQSDGSGDLVPKLLLFEELARSPGNPQQAIATYVTKDYDALTKELATATDNLSTWSQSTHSLAQIDGSVKSPFFRNIAAILAIAGRPDFVNVPNADISGEFIHALPPPPYPFDVNMERAARGEQLYKQHCAVCHYANSTEIYTSLGTDSNRSRVLRPATFDLFLRNFLASVPEDYTYTITGPDGAAQTVRPRSLPVDDVLINRSDPDQQGYLAGALEGMWARAPYLHNGAVPTLRHLLAPRNPESRRPDRFVRGCVSYDTANVGFVWQLDRLAEYQKLDPVAAVYDTSWDGCSNGGHDSDLEVLGQKRKLDWSGDENREPLNDLIEYLKTL